MADRGLINPALLTGIGNKIREKLGSSRKYTPGNMPAAIDDVYSAGVAAGAPFFNMPMPQDLCFVATGKVTWSGGSSITLEFKEPYAMTLAEGERNNFITALAFSENNLTSDRMVSVCVASDVAATSGGTVYARTLSFDNAVPSKLVNSSTSTFNRILVTAEPNTIANVVIFYCDRARYNANPSAYPQKVNLTDMFTSSATLTNA